MTVERLAVALACVLVGAALIAGFTITGSPQQARLQALDERRIEDLQEVARALHRHSSRNPRNDGTLPAGLHAVRPDGSDATRDPQTHLPYRYVRVDANRYRLCATFATAKTHHIYYGEVQHPAGDVCFPFELKYENEPMGNPIRAARTAG